MIPQHQLIGVRMEVDLLVTLTGTFILPAELRAGKLIQTCSRVSRFQRQEAVKIGRDSHRELATVVPDRNGLRHSFFAGFHIGNDVSH